MSNIDQSVLERCTVLGKATGLQERWFECRQSLVGALEEILRQGAAEGSIRRDLPAELLAAYLIGLLRTRANDLVRLETRWQDLEPLIDFFLNGARPDPAASPDRRQG